MDASHDSLPSPEDFAVIVVRPKAPFLEWAASVFGDDLGLDGLADNPNAYLVQDVVDERQLRARHTAWYPRVFYIELNGWVRDPDAWPSDRSWKVFREWFAVELYKAEFDASKSP